MKFQPLLLALGLSWTPLTAAWAQEADSGLRVVGTEFRIRVAEDNCTQEPAAGSPCVPRFKELSSRDLVGRVLEIGNGTTALRVRIGAVYPDPRHADVSLHEFQIQDATGQWQPYCAPDPEGRQAGFPLTGYWRSDGVHERDEAQFSLICTNGAYGKCIRFGYHFWRPGPQGQDLHPYYQACTRLVRADYCGDGQGTTRNGMLIDIYDHIGIQTQDASPNDLQFEAAWTPNGAACVLHPRVDQNTSLDAIRASCPRLADAPLGETCTEASAAHQPGVLLFNRSRLGH